MKISSTLSRYFNSHFFSVFFSFFSLFLIISSSVFAQGKVTGKVVNRDAAPLAGVTVSIKGTANSTQTNESGNFTINAPSTATLVITNIGYGTREVKVGNQTNLSILMDATLQQMTDVVVVGYGVQKKVTVTGAVATVKGTELEKTPTVNLSNSLVGRLPGLSAVQAGGEPGYDGSNIRIRGTNTFGNTSALIVVDGVPDVAGGLDRLNPADIESVSVLKDASGAIYGSRAANGVILVTTKHGKSGKPQLSYTFNHGWAQPTRTSKMANATEYAQMNNETAIFDRVPAGEWAAAGSPSGAMNICISGTTGPQSNINKCAMIAAITRIGQ